MARETLKAARKNLGLTQQQMADKLNISHIYYAKIEGGDRTGIVELWDKMEDLTGIPQRKLREIQDTHPGQADNQ